MESENESEARARKVVYTIVESTRGGKKFWLRIGVAFPNRDGSINVHLDAMPVNGRLHIREHTSWEERSREAKGNGAHGEPLELASEALATG